MKKRVVMHVLGSNNLWGAEKIVAETCKSLSDVEYEMIYTSPEGPIRKILSDMGVSYHALDSMNPGAIGKAIDRYKPDIVHAHDNKASTMSYLASVSCKNKPRIVSHIHNSYPYLLKPGLHRMIDSLIRPRYSANIFCSVMTRDYYKKHAPYFSKLKERIVLGNFTDVEYNKKMAGAGYFREKDDKFRIGFVGRMEHQKGLDAFLAALKISVAGTSSCVIHLVGDGSMKEQLEKSARQLDVKLEGYCENPYVWMKWFDMMVLPSRFEGLPLTVIEAMSLGTPVLAMAVGAIPEIIDDGVNGWTVTPGDYDAFVNKMIFLANHRDEVIETAKRTSTKIESEFNKTTYMKELRRLYEGLTR